MQGEQHFCSQEFHSLKSHFSARLELLTSFISLFENLIRFFLKAKICGFILLEACFERNILEK